MSYNNSVVKIIEAETYDQRLERLNSYFDHLPLYVERGKYSNTDRRNNVSAIRTRPEGSYLLKEWFYGHNIVTNDGRIYYAKRGAGESPAANEGASRMQLSNPTSANTPALGDTWDQFDSAVAGGGAAGSGAAISQSIVTFVTNWPRTNDPDADNTGKGTNVVSYKASWGTTTFNDTQGGGSTIKHGAIHDNASPVAATKLVTHFTFSPAFNKSATDTLTAYVNHAVTSS